MSEKCLRCKKDMVGRELSQSFLRRGLCGRCSLGFGGVKAGWSAGVVAAKKAAGLCVQCGKKDTRERRVTCEDCADRQRISDQKRRRKVTA